MDFSFNRQSSKDFLFKKSESLKASLSGGSSRFMSSASDVKNGLFGGISSMQTKIDEISSKITTSMDMEETPGQVDQTDAAIQRPKQRPKKPPLPKRISESSLNGSVKQFNESTDRTDNSLSKKRIRAPSGEAINFDEPLYDKQESIEQSNYPPTSASAAVSNTKSRTGIQNPFLNDGYEGRTEAEVYTTGTIDSDHTFYHNSSVDETDHRPPSLLQRRLTNPFIDTDDLIDSNSDPVPIVAPQQQPMAGILGSDLLPGIPRVPSQPKTDFLNPSAGGGRDLLAITPTSGEALPMPNINPSPVENEPPFDRDSHEDVMYESDGCSESTEGCDEVEDDPDMYPEGEAADGVLLKSGSFSSDRSWCSNDSNMDELSKDCMAFMKEFVNKIFDNSRHISPVDKSRFGEMCLHEAGRLWFARYINIQRVNKRVSEQTFFQLVQYFAIVLFECNEHEDYGPAKTLMNMCFTFYHEVDHPTGPSYKHFLYSYLKDQSIWQSVKFWNAAFFDAVMTERSRPQQATGATSEREYQENIVFGQLGTFTCNMRALGLSKDLCLDFLRKQSSVVTLREEQLQMLRDNIERTPDSYYGRR